MTCLCNTECGNAQEIFGLEVLVNVHMGDNITIVNCVNLNVTQMQVSGFITQYKGLAFMTFKAAGHRVPSDTPEDAYIMFTNFIADTLNATTIYQDFEGGLQSSIGIQ